MPTDLSPATWAQIRYEYEYTERPIPDICAERGISTGTLRDRMRRWNWRRRRPPIPAEGPPPAPAPAPRTEPAVSPFSAPPEAAPVIYPFAVGEDPVTCRGEAHLASAVADARLAPTAAPSLDPSAVFEDPAGCRVEADAPAAGECDPATIAPRLQHAVVRVLPAIEATVARLAAQPFRPRETEQAARALAVLTRSLRELNALLRQHPAPLPRQADEDPVPEDLEEFRERLLRKIEALAAADAAEHGSEPQAT